MRMPSRPRKRKIILYRYLLRSKTHCRFYFIYHHYYWHSMSLFRSLRCMPRRWTILLVLLLIFYAYIHFLVLVTIITLVLSILVMSRLETAFTLLFPLLLLTIAPSSLAILLLENLLPDQSTASLATLVSAWNMDVKLTLAAMR